MAIGTTPPAEPPAAANVGEAAQSFGAEKPSGPAAAAMIAAGIGALVLGLMATLSEASASIHDWLQFNDRVGPLSGKTIIASAAFFAAWGLLSVAWRRSNPALRPVAVATVVLVLLGLVGTFPTFFLAFASE